MGATVSGVQKFLFQFPAWGREFYGEVREVVDEVGRSLVEFLRRVFLKTSLPWSTKDLG